MACTAAPGSQLWDARRAFLQSFQEAGAVCGNPPRRKLPTTVDMLADVPQTLISCPDCGLQGPTVCLSLYGVFPWFTQLQLHSPPLTRNSTAFQSWHKLFSVPLSRSPQIFPSLAPSLFSGLWWTAIISERLLPKIPPAPHPYGLCHSLFLLLLCGIF